MRQRKVKNVEKRIAEHHQYLVEDPKEKKGKWQHVFGNDRPIFVEFGSGKGKFITALAEQNPDRNYIAIECRKSIILRVLEKAKEKDFSNIVVIYENVTDGLFNNLCHMSAPLKRTFSEEFDTGRF